MYHVIIRPTKIINNILKESKIVVFLYNFGIVLIYWQNVDFNNMVSVNLHKKSEQVVLIVWFYHQDRKPFLPNILAFSYLIIRSNSWRSSSSVDNLPTEGVTDARRVHLAGFRDYEVLRSTEGNSFDFQHGFGTPEELVKLVRQPPCFCFCFSSPVWNSKERFQDL